MDPKPRRQRRFSYSAIEGLYLRKKPRGQAEQDPAVKGLRYLRQGPGVYAQLRVWDPKKPIKRGKNAGKLGAYRVTELGRMPTVPELKERATALGTTMGEVGEQVLEEVRAKARLVPQRARPPLGLPELPSQPAEAHTVAQLVATYLELEGPKVKPKTLRDTEAMLRRFVVPKLGLLRVVDVKQLDIASLHASLKDTPHQANRVLGALSVMFSKAEAWGWREGNPARGVKRFPETERTRWLTEEELGRMWAVLDRNTDHSSAQALKLSLLTGARPAEVLGAKWTEFQLEGDEPAWSVPANRAKMARQIVRQLPAEAVSLLRSIPRKGAWLFPGKEPGSHLKRINERAWARWKAEAGLTDPEGTARHERLVPYTLRHTVASHMVNDGEELLTAARQLGHSSIKSTARYAHLSPGKQREAISAFGRKLGRGG